MPPRAESPQGLGEADKRLHNAWYSMWWQMYVQSPRDTLRGKALAQASAARRASLLKHPRI